MIDERDENFVNFLKSPLHSINNCIIQESNEN